MKPAIYAVALLSATALPVFAAAPPFETTAPVAYLIDLSSGAVLYAKDADRKIPPASMAKMMTTHVVFDMIKKGELKLDQMITQGALSWPNLAQHFTWLRIEAVNNMSDNAAVM